MRSLLPWIAPLLAYGLIGWGVFLLYPLACPLALGGLLWLDLFLYRR